MIRNELKFCDIKKVLLAVILSAATLLYILFFQLLPNQKTVGWDELEKMKQAVIPLSAAVTHMEQEMDVLNKMISTAKESGDQELDSLETQKQSLQADMARYKTLYEKVNEYQWNHAMREDALLQQKYWEELDELISQLFINEIKSHGRVFDYQGYGVHSELDWANRVLLRLAGTHDGGSDANMSGIDANLYIQAVLGNSHLFAAASIFIIGFLNVSIWSRDFEENEGRLLLTLPYKRKVLFRTRIWVRLGVSLAVIVLPLLGVFIWMGIRYGFGMNRAVLLNRSIFTNPFTNMIAQQKMETGDFLAIHQVVPQWQAAMLLVVGFLLWLITIFLLFNLINLFLRSSLLGIFAVLVAVVGVFQSTTVMITNPLSFFLQSELLYGLQRVNTYTYRIIEPGVAGFWGLLILISVAAYRLAKWKFERM